MQAIEGKQNLQPSASERIKFLDNLRAMAIIMVVGVHTLGYCRALPPGLEEVIAFCVHTISVPVFFLVDGYIFAHNVTHSKRYSYLMYVRKSVFRLVIPWVVFTLTYTLARYGFELTGLSKERLIVGHPWQEVIISAYGSVYAEQMYFLLSLFFIRLCCPIIKELFVSRGYLSALLLFALYYTAYKASVPYLSPYLRIAGGNEPVLHALWGAQFYLAGIIIFRTSQIMDLKRLFVPVSLLFTLCLLIGKFGIYSGALVQFLYLITSFLFFIQVPRRLPILDTIGRNTMGIYLLHSPIVLKSTSMILNTWVLTPILSFMAIVLSCLFLTICIAISINAVPYGRLVFGIPYRRRDFVPDTPFSQT
jgi:fucose 4-O-acetylase-like acetyltransferase